MRKRPVDILGRAALAVAFSFVAAAASAASTAEDSGVEVKVGGARSSELCAPPKAKLTATLRIKGTNADLRALLVSLRYPQGKLIIPGTANERSVAERVKTLNGSATVTPNDSDGQMKIELIDPFAALGYPPAQIEFDRCGGQAVSAADFDCRVEFASDKAAAVLKDVTCALDVR